MTEVTYRDDRWYDPTPLPNEEWRPVVGYEESYAVSSLGRVRSIPRQVWNGRAMARKRGRVLRHGFSVSASSKRYHFVNLSQENIQTTALVHRLVAMAFLPRSTEQIDVNHISGDTEDNSVSNLEWCTSRHNTLHAYESGLIPTGEAHHYSKLKADQVVEIRQRLKQGALLRELAADYSVSEASISNIKHGRSWRHLPA